MEEMHTEEICLSGATTAHFLSWMGLHEFLPYNYWQLIHMFL